MRNSYAWILLFGGLLSLVGAWLQFYGSQVKSNCHDNCKAASVMCEQFPDNPGKTRCLITVLECYKRCDN
jgi:hypothetical protein